MPKWLFIDEGQGDYKEALVFDNRDVEKVTEEEEFVVRDVGQALAVKRSFLTSLEDKSDRLCNNIFQSICTVGRGSASLLLILGVARM